MDFEAVYTHKVERSKQDFLRKLFVRLGSHAEAATDILNSTFSEVEEKNRDVVFYTCHIDADFSVSIGYDRKELYWDKEKYTESGKTYYRNVQKERTVTDWNLMTGQYSMDSSAVTYNNKEDLIDQSLEYKELDDFFKNIETEKLTVQGESTLNPEAYEKAKYIAKLNADLKKEFSLPGDHRKDFNSDAKYSNEAVSCIKLPYYTVEYNYNGTTYKYGGFACGKVDDVFTFPKEKETPKQVVDNEFKKVKKISLISWIVFAALLIIIAAVVINVQVPLLNILWIIVAGSLGWAIYYTYTRNKEYKKRLSELKDYVRNLKINNTNNFLKSHNLKELSEEELKLFSL